MLLSSRLFRAHCHRHSARVSQLCVLVPRGFCHGSLKERQHVIALQAVHPWRASCAARHLTPEAATARLQHCWQRLLARAIGIGQGSCLLETAKGVCWPKLPGRENGTARADAVAGVSVGWQCGSLSVSFHFTSREKPSNGNTRTTRWARPCAPKGRSFLLRWCLPALDLELGSALPRFLAGHCNPNVWARQPQRNCRSGTLPLVVWWCGSVYAFACYCYCYCCVGAPLRHRTVD